MTDRLSATREVLAVLKAERISPSIVVTDGRVRIGGIWLPVSRAAAPWFCLL